jgi:hypothetical protein
LYCHDLPQFSSQPAGAPFVDWNRRANGLKAGAPGGGRHAAVAPFCQPGEIA